MKILICTIVCMIFANCSAQKEKKYNTKEIYISDLSPCGTINTGGLIYCSKNVQYQRLERNNFIIIDKLLNESAYKKVFPTKLPNKYYYAKIINNENNKSTTLILLENAIFIIDENNFISFNSDKYLIFFNSLSVP